jgi:hypothetical protein
MRKSGSFRYTNLERRGCPATRVIALDSFFRRELPCTIRNDRHNN